MTLRIIGDTHGKNNRLGKRYYHGAAGAEGRTYMSILNNADYKGVKHTLQIGDIGWREDLAIMAGLSPDYHKVLYGNHDDYDNILPHSIGDYGIMTHGGVTFGYLRGEYSIDRFRRLEAESMRKYGKTYWEEEELTYKKMLEALDFFKGRDINLFISHGAPHFLIHQLVDEVKYEPSMTSRLLTEIHDECNINNWIFGHYHRNQELFSTKTRFLCINELAFVDVTDQGIIGTTF